MVKSVKPSRLGSASNTVTEVTGVLSLNLQNEQLQRMIEVLVEPDFATNVIFGTAYISNNIEKINT